MGKRKKYKRPNKLRGVVFHQGVLGQKSVIRYVQINSMDHQERIEAKRKKRAPRKRENKPLKTSAGELAIVIFLNKHDIKFAREQEFKTCRSPKTKTPLRFDFYIQSQNTVIEFDGRQHFKPAKAFHGEHAAEKLKQQQYNDAYKNDWCRRNNVKIVRIPYWEINNIAPILAAELL